jgi:hypothetical protein
VLVLVLRRLLVLVLVLLLLLRWLHLRLLWITIATTAAVQACHLCKRARTKHLSTICRDVCTFGTVTHRVTVRAQRLLLHLVLLLHLLAIVLLVSTLRHPLLLHLQTTPGTSSQTLIILCTTITHPILSHLLLQNTPLLHHSLCFPLPLSAIAVHITDCTHET